MKLVSHFLIHYCPFPLFPTAHALGFFHEQSRWDRDSFVQIQTQNVLNGFLNQFLRLSQSSTTSFGIQVIQKEIVNHSVEFP